MYVLGNIALIDRFSPRKSNHTVFDPKSSHITGIFEQISYVFLFWIFGKQEQDIRDFDTQPFCSPLPHLFKNYFKTLLGCNLERHFVYLQTEDGLRFIFDSSDIDIGVVLAISIDFFTVKIAPK